MYFNLIFIYLTMKKKKKLHNKVTFKTYNQNQLLLIPPSWDSFIEENHPVRIVNRIVDQLDLKPLILTYEGGGSSSYHPKMLLKVLVYGYLRNIYSSRKIETALKENIHFMWLSGMQFPDHNTINDFRSKRLEGQFKSIFTQVVLLLVEEGLVDIKDIYTDGTKIEANANRYTFVWAKAIKRNKERIKTQLEELWAYVQQIYQSEEEQVPEKPNFEAISPDQVEATINSINEALADKDIEKKKADKLKYAKRWSEKLRGYEAQEAILNGRNSYSKTDTDASFMRNKEDYMKNGQLTPCYNIQFSTSDKFVVNYSIGQTTSDTVLYKTHMESYYEQYGFYPDSDTADAGYGSEENYELLAQKGMIGYVKYPSWYAEHTGEIKKKVYNKYNWSYDQAGDFFICPEGKKLQFLEWSERTNKNGYQQHFKVYECEGCLNCPVFEKCRGERASKKTNRRIHINERLEEHKQKAKELLLTEKGKEQRSNRATEVETPFGNIKYNLGHRRFILRGLKKVNVEFLLLAIAHNLRKVYCKITGVWEEYYAQRAAKRAAKKKKGKK